MDILVAGVGTGGTVSGTGAYLKKQNPEVKVAAVEPAGSPVLSEGHPGARRDSGYRRGMFLITEYRNIDEVITIADEEAFEAGRELAAKDGLLVGISSGAAVAAATKLTQHPKTLAR